MSSHNKLASELARCATEVLPGPVARDLFLAGGSVVGGMGPLPVTASEVRALAADDAALAASLIESPDAIASLWASDQRVSVRKELMLNPRIPSSVAATALDWSARRGDVVPFAVAKSAGVAATIEVLSAVEADLVTFSVVAGEAELWCRFLGPDSVSSFTGQWSVPLWCWAALFGPSDDVFAVDEAWVDTLVSAAPAEHLAGIYAAASGAGALDARWARRFAVRPSLLPAAWRHSHSRVTISDPDAFSVVAEATPPEWVNDVIAAIERLENRASMALGSESFRFGPAVADVFAEVMASSSRSPGTEAAAWLADRVSAAGAESFARAASPNGWNTGRWMRTPVSTILGRVSTGDAAASVVAASGDTSLLRQWVAGEFPLNLPTAELVTSLALDAGCPTEVLRELAPFPHLWAHDPVVASAVGSDDEALASLVGSPACFDGLVETLLAPPGAGVMSCDTDPVWASNVTSAAARFEWCPPATSAALLNHVPVPEPLRPLLAVLAGTAAQWASSSPEGLNPPTEGCFELVGVDFDGWVDDLDRSEVCARLAQRGDLPLWLRVDASLAMRAGTVLWAADLLAAGPVDSDRLLALLGCSSFATGSWLASEFPENLPTYELASMVLDADAEGSPRRRFLAFAEATNCDFGTSQLDVLLRDWCLNFPGVFDSAGIDAVGRLIAVLVTPTLGESRAAWSLFVELANGSNATIAEILALVEAACHS